MSIWRLNPGRRNAAQATFLAPTARSSNLHRQTRLRGQFAATGDTPTQRLASKRLRRRPERPACDNTAQVRPWADEMPPRGRSDRLPVGGPGTPAARAGDGPEVISALSAGVVQTPPRLMGGLTVGCRSRIERFEGFGGLVKSQDRFDVGRCQTVRRREVGGRDAQDRCIALLEVEGRDGWCWQGGEDGQHSFGVWRASGRCGPATARRCVDRPAVPRSRREATTLAM